MFLRVVELNVYNLDKLSGSDSVNVQARVTRLLKDDEGHVVGVEYEKDGATLKEHGPVVICTGG